jgi:hypothetical protein
VRTACVFFQDTDFTDITGYDPDAITGVWRVPRFSRYPGSKDRNTRAQSKRDIRRLKRVVLKYLGGPPEVILCKNYVAPIESRVIYPDVPLVYLVSGSIHATKLKTTGTKIIQLMHPSELAGMYPLEVQANQKADLIIPNSSISAAVFNHIYQKQFFPKISPPINTSEIMTTADSMRSLPFTGWAKRKYDVAFIVSNVERHVKGPHIARAILSQLPDSTKKLVVGDNSETWQIPNTTTRTVQPHRVITSLLLQTKVVIMPSLFDASPNLLAETLEHGAYPVTTLNIGNSEYLVDNLRVTELENTAEWISKISSILEGNLPEKVFKTDGPQRPKGSMGLRLLSKISELIKNP